MFEVIWFTEWKWPLGLPTEKGFEWFRFGCLLYTNINQALQKGEKKQINAEWKIFFIHRVSHRMSSKLINLINGNISRVTKWSNNQLSLPQCSIRLTQNSFNLSLQLCPKCYECAETSFLNTSRDLHSFFSL